MIPQLTQTSVLKGSSLRFDHLRRWRVCIYEVLALTIVLDSMQSFLGASRFVATILEFMIPLLVATEPKKDLYRLVFVSPGEPTPDTVGSVFPPPSSYEPSSSR